MMILLPREPTRPSRSGIQGLCVCSKSSEQGEEQAENFKVGTGFRRSPDHHSALHWEYFTLRGSVYLIKDNTYNLIAFHTPNSSNPEDLSQRLRLVDELVRLLEIRVEELERSDRGISLSIRVEKPHES